MSEPGSWLMVACLPHYNEKAARAAKRKDDGPTGAERYCNHQRFVLFPRLHDLLLLVYCWFILSLLFVVGFDIGLINVCSALAKTDGADAPRYCCDYGRLKRNHAVPHGPPFSRRHPEIRLYDVGCLDRGSEGDR